MELGRSGTLSAARSTLIDDMAVAMADASICGLGQIALTPVLSVLHHFPRHGAR